VSLGLVDDVLQESVLLSESVKSSISITLGADETAKAESCELAGNSTSLLVNVSNVDLDSSVILGGDQAVGGGAK